MQKDSTSTWPTAATDYAAIGWAIFPCYSVYHGGGCTCGKVDCGSPGKHPLEKLAPNGLKNATTDKKKIERWWRREPGANIAVATGRASGIVVVDIDPRHGGDKTLDELVTKLGTLPGDWTVSTGGGGTHYFFSYPADVDVKSRNGWRPGIDIKACGGYVIAPPSNHIAGKRYEWVERHGSPPPPLPAKWLDAITEPNETPPAPRSTTANGRSVLLQRAQQYAATAVGAGAGGRNQAAFNLAGHVASFSTDSGDRLDEADVVLVLQSWNQRCSPPLPDRELQTTVASALTNGKPRVEKQVRVSAFKKGDGGEAGEEKERKSQATILVELAGDVDLFHDRDGEAYARFPVGDGDDLHWEVSRVFAKPFRRWLKRHFYKIAGKAPSAQSLQDALGVIEAKAVYDGDRRGVFVRLAEHEGRIYLDLGNDRWRAIEIDRIGWRIVTDPPVMFRRAKAMLALPTPELGGNVNLLRRFVNVADQDWPLILAWLAAAMRPVGPYPVLAIHGEHGSAKSTLARLLRSIVDPNTSPLRADYREPRDLMICASSGWIVALDNLSDIRPWLSDCFCRLSTGGGFSTRTLYENDEETIFDAQRPLILNCIDDVVNRSDLLDRCVLVNLPRIDGDKRISEAQLHREFNAALPSIFGGLLAAVSVALRDQDQVKLPTLPRMADFAIWATAAEPALGLSSGQFIQAYTASREAGNETAIEASPVGKVLMDFVQDRGAWSGTATELMKELESRVDDKTKWLKSWPATARTLGGIVKRLAPNLREAEIEVEFGHEGRGRQKRRCITLNRMDRESIVPTVPNGNTTEKQGQSGDDGDANDINGDARGTISGVALNPCAATVGTNGDDGDAKIPAYSTATPEPEWIDV